ncbi:DegV family protein [Streptococcus sp. DD13]|uniref:DegV family protein n=1 Tax=Streptococcus sp. DD13 TaxID=1777881 RepID=UPI0007917900|nr:DegV family protein [Streptococcus sp. DD13]KXT78841.1 DegV family protein [Streptococcus sp. DD13]
MKLAVITDSSAVLSPEVLQHSDLYILDIPVIFGDETFVEGKNITTPEFFEKMAEFSDLPKTSQPSLLELTEMLEDLKEKGYTHVIGLFLAAGISGFHQNIQYLTQEFDGLEIAFPDTRITSSPMGMMVERTLRWADAGTVSYEQILNNLQEAIEYTQAYIMVDDLNHLVKGGRLSNGAALLGNLLKIKPILYFTKKGTIEVYEKVRTEKKAVKRLAEIMQDITTQHDGRNYQIDVIHANAPEKAEAFKTLLADYGVTDVRIVTFGSVIATHLGEGAIAFGIIPVID